MHPRDFPPFVHMNLYTHMERCSQAGKIRDSRNKCPECFNGYTHSGTRPQLLRLMRRILRETPEHSSAKHACAILAHLDAEPTQ